ncbi:MAG: 50S ribosomal protein L21 [Candidatus Paceibacterota bacterium]
MSFAVIKTGGKQYKVSEGDQLLIEKLDHEVGVEFDFDEVLLVGNAKPENAKIGQPLVEGAKVHARVMDQGKAKKKIVFKYSNKTRYKKKKGHRQPFTKVEILKIVTQ